MFCIPLCVIYSLVGWMFYLAIRFFPFIVWFVCFSFLPSCNFERLPIIAGFLILFSSWRNKFLTSKSSRTPLKQKLAKVRMFLLPSNLSGSWPLPLTTLGIPLRSWQLFRSSQTKLEFLVILQRLDMKLFSVTADLSPPSQILGISLSGC